MFPRVVCKQICVNKTNYSAITKTIFSLQKDMVVYRLTKILQPKISTPPGKIRGSEIMSVSQKLLYDLGMVYSSSNGTNVLLPLAVRVVDKLKQIIRVEMNNIGAQEVYLPTLTSLDLLKLTGRSTLPELFRLSDRHERSYVLSPTHEEAITNLVSSVNISQKQLPMLLYQISNKFRDEIKPRFGIIRSREFLMKDLYCFEQTPEKSKDLYNEINKSYHNILKKLKIPYCCVEGCSGEIGGSISHEFHIVSTIGEDKVVECRSCSATHNAALFSDTSICSECKSNNVKINEAIEVAHSFLLGTKYSKPLKALYKTSDSQMKPLEMSCHGIGVSRLLAAGVEALSTETAIRWPKSIAPFTVCVIPPKAGSKEEKANISTEELFKILEDRFPGDVLIDDRGEWTIGKRLKEAKQMGYPLIIVIGKSSILDVPLVEIHELDKPPREVEYLKIPNSLPDQL